MKIQEKQYLQALLDWGNKVQSKAEKINLRENRNEWYLNMEKWKGEITNLLDSELEVTRDSLVRLKEVGEQLVQDLMISERQGKKGVGNHKLPALRYSYDALEPYISEEIMKLHHDVHHKSYVDGLNKAEKMIEGWNENLGDSELRHWMREQSFNGSGHYLHTLFWEIMTPNGGGNPKGDLLKKIKEDFSSIDNFKKLFTHAAQSVQGSGWVMLVWDVRSGKLTIQTIEKHNMYALWDVIPLLVLDLWEHSYYLQYKTDRNKYIKNWWNVVNWEAVQDRYNKVSSLKWKFA